MNGTREDAALRSDMAYIDIERRDFQMLGTPAALAELFGALAQATGEFTKIHKNREVTIKSDKGSYTFVYAELSESIDATRPALSRHGLDVLQPYTKLGGNPILRTLLTHKGGAMLVLACEIPPAANVKDLGGSLSYLRRYTYNALLCLAADEDLDDQPEVARGETGAQSGPRRTPEVPAQARQQAAPKASTSAAGAPTSSAPATGQRTGASTASTPATPQPQGGATSPKAQQAGTSPTQTSPQPHQPSPSTTKTSPTSTTGAAPSGTTSTPETPTSAGSLTGPTLTSSAAGSQTPQTSVQPSAASAPSVTPTAQSQAAASSPPSTTASAPKDEPRQTPAASTTHWQHAATDDGSLATEEQKLQMHAILEAMRIGRPARNGYVSDLMSSIGVSGKLTMVSAARVLTELEARRAAFLASPGL